LSRRWVGERNSPRSWQAHCGLQEAPRVLPTHQVRPHPESSDGTVIRCTDSRLIDHRERSRDGGEQLPCSGVVVVELDEVDLTISVDGSDPHDRPETGCPCHDHGADLNLG